MQKEERDMYVLRIYNTYINPLQTHLNRGKEAYQKAETIEPVENNPAADKACEDARKVLVNAFFAMLKIINNGLATLDGHKPDFGEGGS